jgi:predicted TIM-barrel fold metal-dependent hydrolase
MKDNFEYFNSKKTRREAMNCFAGLGFATLGIKVDKKIAKMPVIEWNAHIFSSKTDRYPIHPNAVYRPDLSIHPENPLAAYIKRLNDEKIDKAVIVHPEPYGDDHRLIIDCLNEEPERLKGTSLFYPKDLRSPQKLEQLVKDNPNIISTRFHAHRGKEFYMNSFDDDGVKALWKKAYELDLVVELHIGPNYGKQVAKLMKEFRGTKVLIDHLAEPHLGTAIEFSDILDLAAFDNTFMKLSGISHFATDAPNYESSLPFTSRVIKEFGPDKLIWGSGSTSIIDIHMADYSNENRAKVKGSNIQKLLNWK